MVNECLRSFESVFCISTLKIWLRENVEKELCSELSAACRARRERSCPRNNDYFFTFGARGSDGGVIIDAYAVRNLAAFINFSCGGDVCNLKAESVKAEHRDRSFPKVAFYATKDIHAGTELTYQRDVGATSRKSRSKVPCECGARGVNGQVLCHGYL